MLVSREIVHSLLQRISKLLTQEKVRNKTAGGAVFGKFFLENKTCLFSRNWKIIEKLGGVFKSRGPNCAPNHKK